MAWSSGTGQCYKSTGAGKSLQPELTPHLLLPLRDEPSKDHHLVRIQSPGNGNDHHQKTSSPGNHRLNVLHPQCQHNSLTTHLLLPLRGELSKDDHCIKTPSPGNGNDHHQKTSSPGNHRLNVLHPQCQHNSLTTHLLLPLRGELSKDDHCIKTPSPGNGNDHHQKTSSPGNHRLNVLHPQCQHNSLTTHLLLPLRGELSKDDHCIKTPSPGNGNDHHQKTSSPGNHRLNVLHPQCQHNSLTTHLLLPLRGELSKDDHCIKTPSPGNGNDHHQKTSSPGNQRLNMLIRF
ncbi:uncharacterized protein LOC134965409 [Pseudophryne corroboree]|uniref:uncharacterized protein LOC134965409 n=1 Tax=Pseudophryne corroboree TaxID=495146 RepID=UPI003081C5EB